jgi:hypothetical protein
LASAEPGVIKAWQSLDSHLRVINQIAAIATHFGPGLGWFPQIEEYTLGDGFRLADRAIMCTDGELVRDSALFGRPDQGHRTSPWFKTSLKLHTIAEAQARYNAWAADEFDRIHSGPRGGWIGEDGQMHEDPVPRIRIAAARRPPRE